MSDIATFEAPPAEIWTPCPDCGAPAQATKSAYSDDYIVRHCGWREHYVEKARIAASREECERVFGTIVDTKHEVRVEADPRWGIRLSLNIAENLIDYAARFMDPAEIAKHLWQHQEVRDWLVALLRGDDWVVMVSGGGGPDQEARVKFLRDIQEKVIADRLGNIAGRLQTLEHYTQAYWRLYHSIPHELRHKWVAPDTIPEPSIGSGPWQESATFWRQEISKKLGEASQP